jgi:dolichol-phosphate mannosyltransferase
MKEKTFVSAVVYVCNAERIIRDYLLKLHNALGEKFELFEIILVNDFSTDRSAEVIKEAVKQMSGNVTLLSLAWRHKKELAMLAGTDLAVGDFVYEIETTDPDFTWDIIAKLYDKSVTGYDVVAAYPRKGTKFKSRMFYIFLNRISHLKVDPHTETIRIISRKALNRTLVDRGKVRYRKVLYKHCGFPTTSIEYEPIHRHKRAEDLSFAHKVSLASDVFIVFSNIGVHVAVMFSILFLALSVLIGVYALVTYFTGDVISGWTTTMLFLSLGFSGVFIVTAIIAKYISVILQEQKAGNIYTVESLQKLN